jgi:cytidine deaminase
MRNSELIKKAAALVKTREYKGGIMGDVACALLTDKNKVYVGVCSDVGSHTFCAEQAAIGAMITKKEYNIKKIVAVWKNEKGEVFVIPPCGNCRQMMRDINEDNLDNTEVVLDKNKTVKLKKLLPYAKWWKKV